MRTRYKISGGNKIKDKRYWCPHGCGKTVHYVILTGGFKSPKTGFYCIKCKKFIAHKLKELKNDVC